MTKDTDEIVKMLKILLRLRSKGMNEEADLIVKQFQEIKALSRNQGSEKGKAIMSYNGWSNYETWNATLWYGDIFADMAAEGQLGSPEDLQTYVEEMLMESGQLPESGFAADIMNTFLARIDWQEIYDHFYEETEEEEDEYEESCS